MWIEGKREGVLEPPVISLIYMFCSHSIYRGFATRSVWADLVPYINDNTQSPALPLRATCTATRPNPTTANKHIFFFFWFAARTFLLHSYEGRRIRRLACFGKIALAEIMQCGLTGNERKDVVGHVDQYKAKASAECAD